MLLASPAQCRPAGPKADLSKFRLGWKPVLAPCGSGSNLPLRAMTYDPHATQSGMAMETLTMIGGSL